MQYNSNITKLQYLCNYFMYNKNITIVKLMYLKTQLIKKHIN